MGRVTARAAAALVLAFALASCRDDGDPAAPAATTTTAAAGDPSTPVAAPASSAEEAVAALLRAEQEGDHTASYRLLTDTARQALDPPAWARQRNQLAPITGFSVEGSQRANGGATVVTTVEHEPGLDAFVGLTAARERQTWEAREAPGGGWLVEPGPVVEPDYPAVALAGEAALAWARAVQACDEGAATDLQGVASLFGPLEVVSGLCGSTAPLAGGVPLPLAGGPDSQPLVAQYGPEALVWARAVPVTGGNRAFSVVLAPIGSVWKVVAVVPG